MKDILQHILETREVYYDEGSANSSLYICFELGTTQEKVVEVVELLRQRAVWQGGGIKQIRSEQKPVYADQMEFRECIASQLGDTQLLALRCWHEKFPSQEDSWQLWKEALHATS